MSGQWALLEKVSPSLVPEGNSTNVLLANVCPSPLAFLYPRNGYFPDHALWVADRVIMMKQGSIIANGSSGETTTSQNLYYLYVRVVDMHDLKKNFKVCVPRKLGVGV